MTVEKKLILTVQMKIYSNLKKKKKNVISLRLSFWEALDLIKRSDWLFKETGINI